MSDTDRARHEADARLRTVLGRIEAMDVKVEGRVGDETPLTAFDDAVDDFRPDHILIASRAPGRPGVSRRAGSPCEQIADVLDVGVRADLVARARKAAVA